MDYLNHVLKKFWVPLYTAFGMFVMVEEVFFVSEFKIGARERASEHTFADTQM